MTRHFVWCFVCGICAVGCAPSLAPHEANRTGVLPSPVVLGEEFTIANGETGVVGDDFLVHFKEVAEDARCSVGSTCPDEGDAVVVVVLQQPPSNGVSFELHTGAGRNRDAVYGPYRITLVRLEPRPVGEQAVPLPSYRATLTVSKL